VLTLLFATLAAGSLGRERKVHLVQRTQNLLIKYRFKFYLH
jgi:hypothetical protein